MRTIYPLPGANADDDSARPQDVKYELWYAFACFLATDAQALLGEFLKRQPKAKGTRGQLVSRGVIGGYKTEPPINSTKTLTDLHINKRESSEAQFLAEVKKEEPRRSARYPAQQDIDGDLT